eukprot:scaffold5754_cov166-Amphora_coffeaeformis.AAC.4
MKETTGLAEKVHPPVVKNDANRTESVLSKALNRFVPHRPPLALTDRRNTNSNREQEGLTSEQSYKIATVVKALQKFPDLLGVTYRSIEIDDEWIDEVFQGIHEKGAYYFYNPAFTSSSLEHKVTAEDGSPFEGNVHIFIAGMHGKNVSEYSPNPQKLEVVFAPRTVFEIFRYEKLHGWVELYAREVE